MNLLKKDLQIIKCNTIYRLFLYGIYCINSLKRLFLQYNKWPNRDTYLLIVLSRYVDIINTELILNLLPDFE